MGFKIEHHRTKTVHLTAEDQPEIGVKTKCGIVLPHNPSNRAKVVLSEVECGNCRRLTS